MKTIYRIIAVAAAVLMVRPVAAQQLFEHVMTVDRQYPNDGDCHDGILFQFHSQNHRPDGDYNGCSVIDMKTRELIQFIDLGFNQNFHNSSITFAKKKYYNRYIYVDQSPEYVSEQNWHFNQTEAYGSSVDFSNFCASFFSINGWDVGREIFND